MVVLSKSAEHIACDWQNSRHCATAQLLSTQQEGNWFKSGSLERNQFESGSSRGSVGQNMITLSHRKIVGKSEV